MTERRTFVHAADLHLDAPFRRVDAADRRVREACVEATFAAFERVVEVCVEREAAFLVIAGDVYNTAERSFRAQSAFRSAATRLADAGTAVFVAAGNHDPAGGAGRIADSGVPNVHVFSATQVERVAFPSGEDPWCVLYGRSFATSRETANLAREFSRERGDPFAIGVLHANVGGNQQYEPYAPCSLEDLRAARMDYWALGHIHQHQVLAREPHAVYPGSPQGLDPNETGGHGCVAVTVSGAGATVEFIETGQVVWDRRSADLSGAATLDDVADSLQALCEACRDDSSGRPALVRITLEGRSGVHGLLASGTGLEEVVAEVRREQMEGSPWVWLDRVVDRTRPMLDLDRIRGGADFAADVVRIADELPASEVDAMLDEALGEVLAKTRGLDLRLDPAGVLERARDICLDRLLGDEASR